MKKENDYEQLYYDSQYQIKKLQQQIKFLKDEIEILKGNKKLIEYIIQTINKLNEKED